VNDDIKFARVHWLIHRLIALNTLEEGPPPEQIGHVTKPHKSCFEVDCLPRKFSVLLLMTLWNSGMKNLASVPSAVFSACMGELKRMSSTGMRHGRGVEPHD
jgi:hypothetical protein